MTKQHVSWITKELIEKYKNFFSEKEYFLMVYRYGFFDKTKHTLEETGKQLNITRERVRQIEAKCLNLIRNEEEFVTPRKIIFKKITEVVAHCPKCESKLEGKNGDSKNPLHCHCGCWVELKNNPGFFIIEIRDL